MKNDHCFSYLGGGEDEKGSNVKVMTKYSQPSKQNWGQEVIPASSKSF